MTSISMTSINEYDELKPAISGTDLQINPNDLDGLRISYRWLADSRQPAAGTISNDEFGTDQPDMVKSSIKSRGNGLILNKGKKQCKL